MWWIMKIKVSILLSAVVFCLVFQMFSDSYHAMGSCSQNEKGIPEMEVEIQVWNPKTERWVKEIDAPVMSQLRFRVYVHNIGDYDLFNINITNVLPPSVEYVKNSSDPYIPYKVENNTIIWRITSLLHCCGGQDFETFYNVNVTDDGSDISNLHVSAFYERNNIIEKTDFVVVRSFHDRNPPSVELLEPKKGFYIGGMKILPLPFLTVVIGKVCIKVNTSDADLGVERVEIYIDDEIVATLNETPYEYVWSEGFSGRHLIKVISYDFAGNHAEESIKVWKIF